MLKLDSETNPKEFWQW